MAKLGCLLIILATLGLIAVVVVPVLPFLEDNADIDRLLQPLLCQPGETVQRDQYSYTDSEGTSYSMNVYCMGDGVERDVTMNWTLIGMGVFLVPFLIGLFAFIYGVNRSARNRVATLTTASMGNTGWAVPSPGGMSVSTGGASKSASLTQRLKELQEARDAGLISSIEYDRTRQQILDSMDD